MLDVGEPDDFRTADRHRFRERTKRLRHVACGEAVLSGLLGAGQEPRSEVVVSQGVAAATDAPRHRLAESRAVCAPNQELRRGAGQGGSIAAADEVGVAGGKAAPEIPQHGARGQNAVAAGNHLPRQDHLLGGAVGDPPDGRDHALPPGPLALQRVDLEAVRRRRVKAAGSAHPVQKSEVAARLDSASRAGHGDSGHAEEERWEPGPGWPRLRVGVECEATDRQQAFMTEALAETPPNSGGGR